MKLESHDTYSDNIPTHNCDSEIPDLKKTSIAVSQKIGSEQTPKKQAVQRSFNLRQYNLIIMKQIG